MVILKKTLLASALLVAGAGFAFANGGTYVPDSSNDLPVAASNPFDFYIGGGISRDFGRFSLDQGTAGKAQAFEGIHVPSDPSQDQFITESYQNASDVFSKKNGGGWDGELFAGAGYHIQNHFYIGAELFGSVSGLKVTKNSNGVFDLYSADSRSFASDANEVANDLNLPSYDPHVSEHATISLRHSYGISLTPGIMVTNKTMVYGRLGWVRSQFKINDTFNTSIGAINSSANPSKNGLQLGLGVQTMLTSNISAGLEYDWSRYGSMKAVGRAITGGHISTADMTQISLFGGYQAALAHGISFKPTVNTVKLKLAYHFMSI